MQRLTALLAILAAGLLMFAGCNTAGPKMFKDGAYTAEFRDYDSYGYKDYIEVTVENGVVTKVEFDGRDEAGNLKTADAKYESDMMGLQETYPAKYTADLENQYITVQGIDEVDALAGASYSSDAFTALFKALEAQMEDGNTAPLVVDNVPVR